jgi:transcription antitermination factor NusG
VPASLITPVSETLFADWNMPNWYAISTRVNQEKHVAEGLDWRGIPFYLPLYRTVRRRSDRRVALSLPLFPGYLFVYIPLAERLHVLEVPHVGRLIGSQSRPVALPRDEIDRLRRGLSGQVCAEPSSYLAVGCRVRVINGPFEGFKGILVSRERSPRVIISLEIITRSFSVEVSECDLERI